MVFLNNGRFIFNVVIFVGNFAVEKFTPFVVGKRVIVQLFQLSSQVANQLLLRSKGQVFVRLHFQLFNQ